MRRTSASSAAAHRDRCGSPCGRSHAAPACSAIGWPWTASRCDNSQARGQDAMKPSKAIVPAVITFIAFIAAAAPAQAGIQLGADLHGGKPIGDGADDVSTGFGVGAHLGYTLPIPGIDLTP